VREIETETFQDNPPIFREYMAATSEVRALMDTQFKNVKTHARLLSKAMWYEWRTKLQDGLKEGLDRIAENLKADGINIHQREKVLAEAVPQAEELLAALERRQVEFERKAKELDEHDPEEYEAICKEIDELDRGLADKESQRAQAQARLEAAEAATASDKKHMDECSAAIARDEKTQEECRGWTDGELSVLKGRFSFSSYAIRF